MTASSEDVETVVAMLKRLEQMGVSVDWSALSRLETELKEAREQLREAKRNAYPRHGQKLEAEIARLREELQRERDQWPPELVKADARAVGLELQNRDAALEIALLQEQLAEATTNGLRLIAENDALGKQYSDGVDTITRLIAEVERWRALFEAAPAGVADEWAWLLWWRQVRNALAEDTEKEPT
jgi:chromosome segregation ATPase